MDSAHTGLPQIQNHKSFFLIFIVFIVIESFGIYYLYNQNLCLEDEISIHQRRNEVEFAGDPMDDCLQFR